AAPAHGDANPGGGPLRQRRVRLRLPERSGEEGGSGDAMAALRGDEGSDERESEQPEDSPATAVALCPPIGPFRSNVATSESPRMREKGPPRVQCRQRAGATRAPPGGSASSVSLSPFRPCHLSAS